MPIRYRSPFTTFYNALLSLDTSPVGVLYSPDIARQWKYKRGSGCLRSGD